jgi:hypothetical protein
VAIPAFHAVVADQGVHDGFLETVAHVQAAGDIGRWNHDGVGLALAAGGEVALFLPFLVPTGFDIGGLVGLVHGSCYWVILKKRGIIPRFLC